MAPDSLEALLIKAKDSNTKQTVVLAAAEDEFAMQAIIKAKKLGLVAPIFIGKREKIESLAEENELSLSGIEIINQSDTLKATQEAVNIVNSNQADILMKGFVPTKILLREVIKYRKDKTDDSHLSHLGLFEIDGYNRLIGLTDAALNIAPSIAKKKIIIKNAVNALNKLGNQKPKVALLAAIAKLNPKMIATVDAWEITEEHKKNPIADCEIQGPLALDGAISIQSAKHKGIIGNVAGKADLLVVPEINSGNILYKSLTYFARAIPASVILGANSPIVLTSRSDSEESKLYSIALALCLCSASE